MALARAGLVPGAQRDVAAQIQFDVVINHAAGLAGGRAAVGGRTHALERCDAEQPLAVGGVQAAFDVGTQGVGIGRAAAGGQRKAQAAEGKAFE
ncbi:hypothetical protein G6F59_014730 [Rhizopus arrhizus]|nr:hypothetical protein G6F59_014730 [Rhizopus arrhizus]